MNKVLRIVALSASTLVTVATGARADCIWAGNHWNCADRYIYPKTYPWGTAIIDGRYQRPMSPPDSDITYPANRQ